MLPCYRRPQTQNLSSESAGQVIREWVLNQKTELNEELDIRHGEFLSSLFFFLIMLSVSFRRSCLACKYF